MQWLRNLSLKFKLIILLVALTGTILIVFGAIALRDFERDKIAYVLDSGLSHSQSTSALLRSAILFGVEKIKFLARGYDSTKHTFHPYTNSLFPHEERVDILASYYKDPASGAFTQGHTLKKETFDANELGALSRAINESLRQSAPEELALVRLGDSTKWALILKVIGADSSTSLIVAQFNSGQFLSVFQGAQMQDTYILGNNRVIFSPTESTYSLPIADVELSVTTSSQKIGSSDGIYTYRHPKQGDFLISMASVGVGDLKVASLVAKSAALEAVRMVIAKAALFMAFLFCVTVFLSVLFSSTLTASLKRLLHASQQIAKGNFSLQLNEGGDEIGSLAHGFNVMATEIQRLMLETAEKARMEGELKTAQLVQSTLFPKNHAREGEIEIHGFYQPASECSGDWWFYKKIGAQTLFCIGDATGHGVPAALLTSAARSAISSLEFFPDLTLNEMMAIFNRSIYGTANGSFMMTLFLGLYNHQTGVLSYCNASHEAPYLLPGIEGVKKKDIVLLNESTCPRLGENPNSIYFPAQVNLNYGDRILLYTDGVTELKNAKGELWGERTLLKCLISSTNEKKSLPETMALIDKQLKAFQENQPLQDDVTYFMVTRSKAA